MFSFFSGIKSYEWVFITALCATAIALYVLGGQYLELRDKQTETAQSLKHSQVVVQKQNDLSNLTDRLVAESIANQVQKESVLVVTRRGVIDEYLNPTAQPTTVVNEPVQTPQVEKPPEPSYTKPMVVASKKPASQLRPPPKGSGDAARITRLSRLSERMHERFCSASPTDAQCQNTSSPAG